MALVYIDEILFKHSMSPGQVSDALAKISSSRAIARQLRADLKAAINTSPEKGLLATSDFLASEDVVLAAAVEADKHIKERKRATLERCLAISSILNMQHPLREPSYVRARSKPSGGVRVTHDFGLQHRTAQTMVSWVVECHFVPRPFQYTFLGVHKAIAQIKRGLSKGLIHFATLDIENYFGSFGPKLASVLPLPLEWVEHAVRGRHLAVVLAMNAQGKPYTNIPTNELHLLARQGIPQGSTCSSVVAAYCMADLQWSSTSVIAMLNYADNFCLLAPCAPALAKSIGDLVAAIKNLPGGYFKPKIIEKDEARKGFDYLGHHLRKVGSVVQTTASLGNQHSIYDRMIALGEQFESALAQGKISEAHDNLIERCEYLKGWASAFRECDDISHWKNSVLALIQLTAGPWEKDVPHLYATAGRDFEYCVRPYGMDI